MALSGDYSASGHLYELNSIPHPPLARWRIANSHLQAASSLEGY